VSGVDAASSRWAPGAAILDDWSVSQKLSKPGRTGFWHLIVRRGYIANTKRYAVTGGVISQKRTSGSK
jgi:hypothetical protein